MAVEFIRGSLSMVGLELSGQSGPAVDIVDHKASLDEAIPSLTRALRAQARDEETVRGLARDHALRKRS